MSGLAIVLVAAAVATVVLFSAISAAEWLSRIAAALSRAATALEDSNRIRAQQHEDERALADVARTAIRTYQDTTTDTAAPAPVLRFERTPRPAPPEEDPAA
jgi:hypothetical protein